MSGLERIELLIDPGTWGAMDEDMVSVDSIEFHSEEEPYKDRIDSYKKKGLSEVCSNGHRSTKRYFHSNWDYGFSVYGGQYGIRSRLENHPFDRICY
ncbi:hypothetical protein IFM89_030479 [Coptis chinensis]|uniref:Uncharacterized protein n=1 Tax=Coptis chinensis TaxID=261450 RepID=A0A835H6C0_9MAGN|nr:hypothetical protein IFM89_030479 [Coptis chinensis]